VVFLGLELGVGLIQALIFAILTLAFLSLSASHEHSEEAPEHSGH
jgi:F0F1-type ATP synthase membrane subunit a